MYFGRFFGIDEITEQIEAVSPAEVQKIAQQLFRPEVMALTLLGNLGGLKIGREHLAC
jgi:predicted Zn-dependent peptidase